MKELSVIGDSPVATKSNLLVEHSISKNTKRVYAGCLARFFNWLEDRPLNDDCIAEYVLMLYSDGKSHATAAQSVAAIRFRTRTAGMANAVGPRTEQALIGFRRTALNRGRGQVDGLTWEQADTVAEEAAKRGLIGIRDAAIIAVASDAMLRISEIAAIQCEDVTVEPDGTGRLFIPKSKTDQDGRGAILFLGAPTIERLTQWAQAAFLTSGPLFRRVSRDGHVEEERGLCSRTIARTIKRRSREAGINGKISGHSIRVGGAQSLAARGASLVQMQKVGRWKSPSMPGHYSRGERAARGAVAKLRYAK